MANLFHGELDTRTLEWSSCAIKTKKEHFCSFFAFSLLYFIPSRVKHLSRHKVATSNLKTRTKKNLNLKPIKVFDLDSIWCTMKTKKCLLKRKVFFLYLQLHILCEIFNVFHTCNLLLANAIFTSS